MTKTKWNTIHDKTYKAIIKHFKTNPDEFAGIKEVKFEAITNFSYNLENAGIISFGLHSRCSEDGTDYWTQAEYHSKKIRKTIIYNYDYQEEFDSLSDFADKLASTEAYIQEFESKLSFNK